MDSIDVGGFGSRETKPCNRDCWPIDVWLYSLETLSTQLRAFPEKKTDVKIIFNTESDWKTRNRDSDESQYSYDDLEEIDQACFNDEVFGELLIKGWQICRILAGSPKFAKTHLTLICNANLSAADDFRRLLTTVEPLAPLGNLCVKVDGIGFRDLQIDPKDRHKTAAWLFERTCKRFVAADSSVRTPFNFCGLPLELQFRIVEFAALSARPQCLLSLNKPFNRFECSPSATCCGLCGRKQMDECCCLSISIYRPRVFSAFCICRNNWPMALFHTSKGLQELAEMVYFGQQKFCLEGTLAQIRQLIDETPRSRSSRVRELSIVLRCYEKIRQEVWLAPLLGQLFDACCRPNLRLLIYVRDAKYLRPPLPVSKSRLEISHYYKLIHQFFRGEIDAFKAQHMPDQLDRQIMYYHDYNLGKHGEGFQIEATFWDRSGRYTSSTPQTCSDPDQDLDAGRGNYISPTTSAMILSVHKRLFLRFKGIMANPDYSRTDWRRPQSIPTYGEP